MEPALKVLMIKFARGLSRNGYGKTFYATLDENKALHVHCKPLGTSFRNLEEMVFQFRVGGWFHKNKVLGHRARWWEIKSWDGRITLSDCYEGRISLSLENLLNIATIYSSVGHLLTQLDGVVANLYKTTEQFDTLADGMIEVINSAYADARSGGRSKYAKRMRERLEQLLDQLPKPECWRAKIVIPPKSGAEPQGSEVERIH